jgi:glycosyltransferase involved in cell wall biosynthesis
MVDPNNIESLSDEMCRVLKDKELQHRMSRDGLKRSKMFTWEKMVKEVLKIYKDVVACTEWDVQAGSRVPKADSPKA